MAKTATKLSVKNGILWLSAKNHSPIAYKIAVGAGGVGIKKREGDLITPVGRYPLRRLFYRQDRYEQLKSGLEKIHICKNNGWCDDEQSIHYNRLINLDDFSDNNTPPRHEKMHRADHLYNIVIEIGYNDDPPDKGLGSAIFIHVAGCNYSPTHGCIALKEDDLVDVVRYLTKGDYIEIIS